MEIRVPRLIKSLHGEEGMGLTLLQHIVSEHPQLMMNAVGRIDEQFNNDGEPNAAEKSAFPLFEFSGDEVSKSQHTKSKNWNQKSLLLVADKREENKIEYRHIHDLWASALLERLSCVKIYRI